MGIKWEEIEDVEVDGVDSSDAMKFCDAFFSSASHKAQNRELTEDELEQLGQDYPEQLSDMALQSLV